MSRETREELREREARRVERRQKALDIALREMAQIGNGRAVLWALIDDVAGALNGSFAGEATHQTAFAEGQRSVGLTLIAWLQRVAPSDYVRMLGEALERRRAEDAADAQESDDGGRDQDR